MRRVRMLRQAASKYGAAAQTITGMLSTHCPQLSSLRRSYGISPGAAMYEGQASIMTCIMQNQATNSRHSAVRVSARRIACAGALASGAAS